MKKIAVKLKINPYNIILSTKETDFISHLKKLRDLSSIFIITDSVISKIHLNKFKNLLTKSGFSVKIAVIPAGETGKSLKSLSFLYDSALKSGIDRKSCAIALGGGVVGDCAGFFASTYMRGIKLVQIPTTLLAACDSSIGGKTAVNTAMGKNIAGTFYQPSFVWINTDFLKTLNMRQIRNGFAEIIKYAFTFDIGFINDLSNILESGVITEQSFEYIINKCCSYKADIVQKDEKETKGLRALLNLGHTLAHAIETHTKYNKFLHGEAVAIGLLFAAQLSVYKKLCKQEVYDKVLFLLKSANLMFKLENPNIAVLVNLMKKDKKSVNSKVNFTLLKGLGNAQNGYLINDKTLYTQLKVFFTEQK